MESKKCDKKENPKRGEAKQKKDVDLDLVTKILKDCLEEFDDLFPNLKNKKYVR